MILAPGCWRPKYSPSDSNIPRQDERKKKKTGWHAHGSQFGQRQDNSNVAKDGYNGHPHQASKPAIDQSKGAGAVLDGSDLRSN